MKLIARFLKLTLVLLFVFSFKNSFCDPGALYFDPSANHGAKGVNRYPIDRDKKNGSWNLQLSPFYQHASGARNKFGRKVPIGDRLGRWEMISIFWGDLNAAPVNDPVQPTFWGVNNPSGDLFYTLSYQLGGTYDVSKPTFGIAPLLSDQGRTDSTADYSVSVEYEKMGLRGECNFAFNNDFGMIVKGGLVSYRHTETSFRDTTHYPTNVGTEFDQFLTDTLMNYTVRKYLIEERLGLSLEEVETSALEDTFVQFYWSHPFEMRGEKGEHVLTFYPYLGAGVWIPTGKKKDQNKAFSIPTGHDGFWGLAFEGAMNFDFTGMVLLNLGGGLTIFESKVLSGQRVATHYSQRGIYPWTAKIERRFGPAWNVNVSLKAREIIEHLDAYFDYVYMKHEKDSIHMRESSSARNEYFKPRRVEEDSLWKSQNIQLGFNYHVTPDLKFGFCGQTHLYGTRVYKTHTLMGTVGFNF